MIKKSLLSTIALSLLAAACVPLSAEHQEIKAEQIARPAFMVERRFDAVNMDFQLWERMHERHAPANIYIEGDGNIDAIRGPFSEDHSPKNPLALYLASRDLSENIGYISRPCQFRESWDEQECSERFWREGKYADEVIAAYNQILDEMKKRWDITEFNLIGYDGGANIAAILAATRTDVASLRTVAGILNPAIVYDREKHPLETVYMSAMDAAPHLQNMPQHHFIGAGDEYVTAAVYHSFRQKIGNSECVHYTYVPDADHERGWVEKWPELLTHTVECPTTFMPESYVPKPLPDVPVELQPDRPAAHK